MRLVSQDRLIDVPYENVILAIGRAPYYSSTEVRIEARALFGSDNIMLGTMGRYKNKDTAEKVMENVRQCYMFDQTDVFIFPNDD